MLAASIVLALLNVLAAFTISHLLSIVGHDRFAHHTVAAVRFQDLRELTATLNSVTGAMNSDAETYRADRSTEEVETDRRATTVQQRTDL